MKTLKWNCPFAFVAAALMLSAGRAFADDSLIITLPGETFVNTGGIAGAPTNQTVGTAFAIKIHATTDNVNYITDTAFSGVKTVNYTGPSGGVVYVTNVTFTGGSNTTVLNTIITNAQTTTISATATGAMTLVASSSLQVNPKLIVTLPGQTFTAGQATNNGNSGTPGVQTAGVSFNLSSLTAINADNTIDTAFTGDQTLGYFGPANALSGGGTPTYATTVNFANGVSTTTLTTTLVKAETTTITATNAAVVTGVASSSLKVAVNPTAAQIAFTTQTGGGQPGVPWNVQPAVTLQDAYGNGPVTNVAQNVHLAIQNNPASGTLGGTTTVAVNINTGVATFSGLSINNVGANYTLTATGDTLDTTPGTVVSAPFSIRVPTSYDTLILSDSAYAYWPLQDASGPTITDIAGTNNGTMMVSSDTSVAGQDTHTTYTNAVAVSSDGMTYALGGPGFLFGVPGDTALYFTNLNGQNVNAQMLVPYNSNMDVRSNFSAEAWVTLPTYPIGYTKHAYQGIFGLEDNSGTSDDGWVVNILTDTAGIGASGEGAIQTYLAKANRGGWTTITATTNITETTNNVLGFVHVVINYDVASFKLYVNGALAQSAANPGYSPENASTHLGPFVIGSYCANYFAGSQAMGFQRNSFYNGGISHVAFYSNVLSPQQILTHYLTGKNGPLLPVHIGTQPVGGTNYIGYSRTLSVAAAGTAPLSYQWSKNATPIPGTTNSSLVLNNLLLTNAGNYFVRITNSFSGTNSDTVAVVVLPLPSDPYQAAVISQFPSAFYPLHETNGPVANDLIDPVDNNGTYVTYDTNTPVLFSQPGASSYLGTAVAFNPAATNGITITNEQAMGIIGPLTLEAWVKVQDTNDGQWIVAHGPYLDGNPSKTSDRLEITNGNYGVERYSDNSTPHDFGVFYPIPDATNTWVYLVGVADGTYWRLYENGVDVLDTVDTNMPSGAISANGGWAIGGRWTPGGAPGLISPSLNGSINNVAIYDHALSPATIQQHYQIGLTGVPTMSIQKSGANVVVSWTAGFLQEATSITGPWTYDDTNTVTSPYTAGATNAAKFYRATLTPP